MKYEIEIQQPFYFNQPGVKTGPNARKLMC